VIGRPKLLFVSARYLLPPDSGGKIRTGHVLRGMKDGAFDVTLASPAPKGAPKRDADTLAQLCDRFVSWPEVTRDKMFNYLRARHLVSRYPISVATEISAAGRALIESELKRRPDIVVVDFPHTAVLMPKSVAAPTVLFTHNVEAEIFGRQVKIAGTAALRALWRNQFRKMQQFEAETLRSFDAVVAVSERDQAQFKGAYGVASETIPTGVDLDYFAHRAPDGANNGARNIVFTASMDYHANIDGIQWFMDECWPLIARADQSARVTIVGRNPHPKLVQSAAERKLPWTFTGFVDDVRPYVHDAAVYMIPLRVGGGTRIKAYEAMALGCPVVSTTIGVEGLQLEPGRHYLAGDTPEGFAAAVLKLLGNPELRALLSADARELVERHFSAETVGRVFEGICLRALEAPHRARLMAAN